MERLSIANAIRQGSLISEPAQRCYVRRSQNPQFTFKACALGAAVLTLGLPDPTDQIFAVEALEATYPELDETEVGCPVANEHRTHCSSLWCVIAHLNDSHGWTREAIADFVDSLTLDLTPVAVVAQEAS